jgi:hypothetical protein
VRRHAETIPRLVTPLWLKKLQMEQVVDAGSGRGEQEEAAFGRAHQRAFIMTIYTMLRRTVVDRAL